MYRILLLVILFSFRINAQETSCNTPDLMHYNYDDIKLILDDNGCNSCHNNSTNKWSYASYESMFSTGVCSEVIIMPGNAGDSYMMNILSQKSSCLTSSDQAQHIIPLNQVKKIESWINVGAPNACILMEEDIVSMLEINNCNTCHNNTNNISGFSIYDIQINTASQINCDEDQIIDIYKYDNSTLYSILTDQCNSIPYHNVSETDLGAIRDWISAGAPSSSESLPLELLSFSVQIIDGTPKLYWKTTTEIGVNKFEIERSGASDNFISIGEVDARGELFNEYYFSDEDPPAGDSYYRIKIIDYDGRHEYSPIEFVRLTSSQFVFNVYPNPAVNKESLLLKWFSKNDIQNHAKMTLMDGSGKVIKKYEIEEGINRFNLPPLPNGIYYLTVLDYYGGSHYERIVLLD